MKLVILGCAVTTRVKEDDVEYLCINFDMTTDAPFGKRYGVTKNIPMEEAEVYNRPYEEIYYEVQVEMGMLMVRFRRILPEEAENEDAIIEEMRDSAIEGFAAFFSTHKWWSKTMREVHDIKAGSMVMDVSEHEQYMNENDIRVITKAKESTESFLNTN